MTAAIKKCTASDEGQTGLKDRGANESTDLVDHLLKSGSLTEANQLQLSEVDLARLEVRLEDSMVFAV